MRFRLRTHLFVDRQQHRLIDSGIPLDWRDRRVAQQLLDSPEIGVGAEQMRGEAMA